MARSTANAQHAQVMQVGGHAPWLQPPDSLAEQGSVKTSVDTPDNAAASSATRIAFLM